MAATNLPSQVRAVYQPDIQSTQLTLTSLPLQTAAPDTEEHLILVQSTSPCAGELLWAANFPQMISPSRIAVPCYDLSGVVVTAPEKSPFQPGTHVYTRTSAARTGNAREYTIALTSELAIKPSSLSWAEAASVPLSAFTAYQALFVHGGLMAPWSKRAGVDPDTARKQNAEKRVLVTAAAGGVGVLTVQLARVAGVKEIVAVVGTSNIDFIKGLGATEVVDYRKLSLADWATAEGRQTVDLVVDCVGKQTLADAWTTVRDGGILISIVEPPEGKKPQDNPTDVKDLFFIMASDAWQLEEIADLIEDDKVNAVVDSEWRLDQYEEAFKKVAEGHARGKVIINVRSES